jgi:hypothetical protein
MRNRASRIRFLCSVADALTLGRLKRLLRPALKEDQRHSNLDVARLIFQEIGIPHYSAAYIPSNHSEGIEHEKES